MSNILEDLYYGKIFPYNHLVPQNPDFSALSEKAHETERHLDSILAEKERAEFNRFKQMQSELSDMESVEAFSRGFRLGVTLIVDVYYNQGDVPDIIKSLTAEPGNK